MPADLSQVVLGLHTAALPLSFIGIYRFGDRTATYDKSLSGTDTVLARLRGNLADQLAEVVRPLLTRDTVISPILDASGGYKEKPSDPTHGEEFRNTIQGFVDGSADELVAYQRARLSRDSWCRWARVVSWVVLLGATWEGVCFVGLGYLRLFSDDPIPGWALVGSCVPTFLCLFVFFGAFGGMLRSHDSLMEVRRQHDPP